MPGVLSTALQCAIRRMPPTPPAGIRSRSSQRRQRAVLGNDAEDRLRRCATPARTSARARGARRRGAIGARPAAPPAASERLRLAGPAGGAGAACPTRCPLVGQRRRRQIATPVQSAATDREQDQQHGRAPVVRGARRRPRGRVGLSAAAGVETATFVAAAAAAGATAARSSPPLSLPAPSSTTAPAAIGLAAGGGPLRRGRRTSDPRGRSARRRPTAVVALRSARLVVVGAREVAELVLVLGAPGRRRKPAQRRPRASTVSAQPITSTVLDFLPCVIASSVLLGVGPAAGYTAGADPFVRMQPTDDRTPDHGAQLRRACVALGAGRGRFRADRRSPRPGLIVWAAAGDRARDRRLRRAPQPPARGDRRRTLPRRLRRADRALDGLGERRRPRLRGRRPRARLPRGASSSSCVASRRGEARALAARARVGLVARRRRSRCSPASSPALFGDPDADLARRRCRRRSGGSPTRSATGTGSPRRWPPRSRCSPGSAPPGAARRGRALAVAALPPVDPRALDDRLARRDRRRGARGSRCWSRSGPSRARLVASLGARGARRRRARRLAAGAATSCSTTRSTAAAEARAIRCCVLTARRRRRHRASPATRSIGRLAAMPRSRGASPASRSRRGRRRDRRGVVVDRPGRAVRRLQGSRRPATELADGRDRPAARRRQRPLPVLGDGGRRLRRAPRSAASARATTRPTGSSIARSRSSPPARTRCSSRPWPSSASLGLAADRRLLRRRGRRRHPARSRPGARSPSSGRRSAVLAVGVRRRRGRLDLGPAGGLRARP